MPPQGFVKTIMAMLLLCPLGFGQSGNGYGFFAPGQFRTEGASAFGVHFGGGGSTSPGAALASALRSASPDLRTISERLQWAVQPDGYYVFNPVKDGKTQPFITGGYTRAFGHGARDSAEGTAIYNLFNGVNAMPTPTQASNMSGISSSGSVGRTPSSPIGAKST